MWSSAVVRGDPPLRPVSIEKYTNERYERAPPQSEFAPYNVSNASGPRMLLHDWIWLSNGISFEATKQTLSQNINHRALLSIPTIRMQFPRSPAHLIVVLRMGDCRRVEWVRSDCGVWYSSHQIATKFPFRGGLVIIRGKVRRVQIEAGAEPSATCKGDAAAAGPLADDGWRCRSRLDGCT
jgi:hypothetical protein